MNTKNNYWQQFIDLGGEIIPGHDWKQGRRPELGAVAIVELPDECSQFDDLCGDCFEPSCNPDVPEEKLEEERKAFMCRVNRDGVWGYQAMFFDGQAWQLADSIFGFVGSDFKGSGYDDDIARSAVEGFEECREEREGLETLLTQLESV